MKGIMIHKFAHSLFPAADTSPSAKTHTAVPHLSERQTSSHESKREQASTQPTESTKCLYFVSWRGLSYNYIETLHLVLHTWLSIGPS